VLCAALCACAGASNRTVLIEDSAGGAGGKLVVLAPMNLPIALPHDLDEAVPIVQREMIRQLQARGLRVAVIYEPDALALWAAAMGSIERTKDASRDLQAAVRAFAEALRVDSDYQLLVLPSLALREARVSGRMAQWDGVRRRLDVRSRTASDAADTAADQPLFDESGVAAAQHWGGRITGLSLHLLAVREGRRTPLERWGGLDLVHDPVHVRPSGAKSPTTELRLRARLLDDPENVREGVALALDPLLQGLR
jgi:hypothetical protein